MKNRKSNKPHTKPFFRQYRLMDVLLASATQPMLKDKQDYQLKSMKDGLDAMERSDSPQPNDWRCVSDAINLLETALDMGIIDDSEGLLEDAVFAMGEAGARAMKGQTLRLSGPGIQACRGVLLDYAMVLAVLSERAMVNIHRATEKRIREIQQGKCQAHDVQVISI